MTHPDMTITQIYGDMGNWYQDTESSSICRIRSKIRLLLIRGIRGLRVP